MAGREGNGSYAVLDLLHKASAQNAARILFAAEKGSRAFSTDGPGSDWDVRFFYARPTSEYHGLSSRDDVIVRQGQPNAAADYEGWDVVKALTAASASSSTILEAVHSPVRHYAERAFSTELFDIMLEFKPESVMHSYAGMAFNKLKEADANWGDKYVHKGYLYAIRAVMMVLMMDADPYKFPPMDFDELREGLRHNPDLKALKGAIGDVLATKRSGDKLAMHVPVPAIDEWLRRVVPGLRDMALRAPKDRRPNPLRLDHLCRFTVENRPL